MKTLESDPLLHKPYRGKYNWRDLADGKWHLAEKGIDFERTETFKQLPRAWAKNDVARLRDEKTRYSSQVRVLENGDVAFCITPIGRD